MYIYHWYLNHRDLLDFTFFVFKIIFFFIILWVSFFKNYTYYEKISINHYPLNKAPLYKNIIDDTTLKSEEKEDTVLYVSPSTTPVKVTIEKYISTTPTKDIYKPDNSIKPILVEPGQSYKVSYFEGEGIPEYQIRLETDTGISTVSMAFNGKYQVNDRYRIKAKKKLVPFLINRLTE
ncbi:hypothetical protein A4W74_04600 [Latilactobacillus curvatus]|uniref:hypothetical protein n=1 Tax=Latilactobacillus curvatus TaxID=28038 RepID=UPI0020A2F8E9|nr:hypothetical protein [Latilactobacillus curvatus]UTB76004.1 hypothetical protein A4W74_04600 [Latilactobacillus curvatus]